MQTLISKMSSRKFWLAVAAFLASIGTSIAGLAIAEPSVAIAGVVCTIISTAIYNASEAYVDAASVTANGTSKTITVNSNSNAIAQTAIQGEKTE